MSMDYIDVSASPASMVVFSFFGLLGLSVLYGMYGLIVTALQFLLIGPKRFFKQIDRPTPPPKATNTIYGKHEMIKLKSSGISLHYVSKGLPNQPMILFVHGFPECWYSWRNQMKYFSKDYRVVAIDQRGYGLSTKVPYVHDYRVEVLAGDVADVIEQLGYESCVLVGHGLGGLVAWTSAMLYPHLVEKLIIMNCPHPVAFRQELTLRQVRRSWYMFFLQNYFLPEIQFQADDFSIFKKVFHAKSTGFINKDYITDADIEVYKYTFSQPGTTKAAINYYRALLRYQSDFSRAEIAAPVLLLWGCKDQGWGEEYADASQKYCSDIRVKKIANGTHWLIQDIPDVVNKYMELFLREAPIPEQEPEF